MARRRNHPPCPQQTVCLSFGLVEDIVIALGATFLVLAMLLAYRATHVQPSGAVAGGRGTFANPYRIASCDHLQNMRNAVNAAYVLVNDIDCSHASTFNDGAGFFPIGYYDRGFVGSFDGAGYRIRGLRIDRPEMDAVGLFSKLGKDATVSNLFLSELDVTGRDTVGGVAGWTGEQTRLTNIRAEGTVRGRGRVGGLVGVHQGALSGARAVVRVVAQEDGVGGIAGWNHMHGSIDACSATGSVQGRDYVGGAVGVNYEASLADTHVGAIVLGHEVVGGLVGYVTGRTRLPSTVFDSSAQGNVLGERAIGNVIGRKDGAHVVRGCFSIAPEHGEE